MKLGKGRTAVKRSQITIDKFNGGSNSLLDQARMPSQFAVQASNMIQDQDGVWKTKWGSQFYGADLGTAIDGFAEYVRSDNTTELVCVSGGFAWTSQNGGAWTKLTGATFTAGIQCYFLQCGGYDTTKTYYNYLYISNGTDTLARYNGTSLFTYASISTPTGLTASLVASGLSSGTFTYYGEVTALNQVGETIGSSEVTITCNKARDTWVPATDKGVQWTWGAVTSATSYQLYLSDSSGNEALLAAIPTPTVTFVDDGSAVINPYIVPPLLNSTTAPKFKSMCLSTNRIWGTNDSNNKYVVYFSGTGTFIGNFSDFYGGGWVALERGGKEVPVAVVHYQKGTGEGCATAFCSTPDGNGAIWQLSIATATVGTTSFPIPSASKSVGSFGTESILGVAPTTYGVVFPNRKGWFSFGPRRQFYGLLITQEESTNIRPYWRNLISSKLSGVCAYFYDAKVFISVPTSTTGNDRIIVFDTEKQNWAVDWTNGAKQFGSYTDTSKNTHFLYAPTSGTKLIELSPNYMNDLGTAFNQTYVSPLISPSANKTDVFALQQAILELGRPQGSVNFSILGVAKDGSFSTIASTTITNFGSNTGIGTDLFGKQQFGNTNASVKKVTGTWTDYLISAPTTYAQATTRKAILQNSRLYAIQFKVASTTASTVYSILNIQATGTTIHRKVPSAWLS